MNIPNVNDLKLNENNNSINVKNNPLQRLRLVNNNSNNSAGSVHTELSLLTTTTAPITNHTTTNNNNNNGNNNHNNIINNAFSCAPITLTKSSWNNNLVMDKGMSIGDINTGSIMEDIEGAFKCKVCNKGFKRKTNLNAHAKIHTGNLLWGYLISLTLYNNLYYTQIMLICAHIAIRSLPGMVI